MDVWVQFALGGGKYQSNSGAGAAGQLLSQ
jgi:hypothetical protein